MREYFTLTSLFHGVRWGGLHLPVNMTTGLGVQEGPVKEGFLGALSDAFCLDSNDLSLSMAPLASAEHVEVDRIQLAGC